MKRFVAILALGALAGCGQPATTVNQPGATSVQARSTTTEPIGKTDLSGRVSAIAPGTAAYQLDVVPVGQTQAIRVVVPTTVPLKTVRGQQASKDGMALKFLFVGCDVRLKLVDPKASPAVATAIYEDWTGVPI